MRGGFFALLLRQAAPPLRPGPAPPRSLPAPHPGRLSPGRQPLPGRPPLPGRGFRRSAPARQLCWAPPARRLRALLTGGRGGKVARGGGGGDLTGEVPDRREGPSDARGPRWPGGSRRAPSPSVVAARWLLSRLRGGPKADPLRPVFGAATCSKPETWLWRFPRSCQAIEPASEPSRRVRRGLRGPARLRRGSRVAFPSRQAALPRSWGGFGAARQEPRSPGSEFGAGLFTLPPPGETEPI